jgi:serine/threonine protein kinase
MGCRQSKSPSATTCSSATDSSITVSAISTERFQIDRSLTQSLFLAHDSLKVHFPFLCSSYFNSICVLNLMPFSCFDWYVQNVDCVIKRLSKSDWHSKASFIQESHIMRRLAHPNIVTMLDAIDNPKDYTMVFEFLSGKPLFQQFTRCNRSNEHVRFSFQVLWLCQSIDHSYDFVLCFWLFQKLALYCRQILQALAFCHSNDVVHRDIKPASLSFSRTSFSNQLTNLFCTFRFCFP